MKTLYLTRYESPLGPYVVVTSHRGVACFAPEEEGETRLARWQKEGIQIRDGGPHSQALARELDAYFAGQLRRFSVPLDLRGTPFQRQVWALLGSIPYGETRSYRWVAQGLGRPTATRAVGQAIGSNPVSIVVPCHRVIGSNGRLTGYAGGLPRKQALLALEAAALKQR